MQLARINAVNRKRRAPITSAGSQSDDNDEAIMEAGEAGRGVVTPRAAEAEAEEALLPLPLGRTAGLGLGRQPRVEKSAAMAQPGADRVQTALPAQLGPQLAGAPQAVLQAQLAGAQQLQVPPQAGWVGMVCDDDGDDGDADADADADAWAPIVTRPAARVTGSGGRGDGRSGPSSDLWRGGSSGSGHIGGLAAAAPSGATLTAAGAAGLALTRVSHLPGLCTLLLH